MTSDGERLEQLVERGELLTESRELVEARRVLEEAVACAEKVHGPDALETVDVLHLLKRSIGLARVDDPDLFPISERMYRIALGAFGASDRRMYPALADYAGALEMVGRSEEALELYARAVELAEPLDGNAIFLLFRYVRALAEARRTAEALRVVDRMRQVEAHEEPWRGFSPLAACAVAHFADPAEHATVLKYIDENMSAAADSDRQLQETRESLRRSTGT